MQSYKSVFYQKKEAPLLITIYNLTLSESFCLTDHEKNPKNPKVRGTLKGLPKTLSKRSHLDECVHES